MFGAAAAAAVCVPFPVWRLLLIRSQRTFARQRGEAEELFDLPVPLQGKGASEDNPLLAPVSHRCEFPA